MSAERRFIRHTVDVPLEITPEIPDDASDTAEGPALHARRGVNVSSGGLAFIVEECLNIGDVVQVRIPSVEPPFEARARVVWCREEDDAFLAGVEFLDAADAFRVRMVEQVCAVEQYRRKVHDQEGRVLTPQEAAAEWIGKYAGRFPGS